MSWIQVLLFTVLPAVLVLLCAVLVLQRQSRQVEDLLKRERAIDARRQTLPVRLQAYERMTLLMERISPESLLMRVSPGDSTAVQYKQLLLEEIAAE